MRKIINFISKNIGKIIFISSLSFNDKDAIKFIILLLIVLYLYRSKKSFFDKIFKFFKKDKRDKSHKSEEELINHINNKENIEKSNNIKNNIKLICKKNDKKDPYMNEIPLLQKNYNNKPTETDFILNVNSTICSTPIFNLRTYKELDFHYNFIIHDYDTKKINNLIMCKDIHKWMTSSSLTNEDLSDELAPIYFIKKKDGVTDVFEYLKLFVHTDAAGVKIGFVQKGIDYLLIKNDIDELINNNLIKDLLSDKHYTNYNLSTHDGVSDFLEKILSLMLIPEHYIGEKIQLDIENYYENKKTYEYMFNTINSDANMFNTTI